MTANDSLPLPAPRILFVFLCLGLLLWCTTTLAQPAAADEVEVYSPIHRTPASLITTLAPLFGDSASFSSDGRQLIVKAAPATLSSVLKTLGSIDIPLRQFRVQLSDHPVNASTEVYSTQSRSFKNQSFRVMENETLTLAQETRAQTATSVSPWWTQVAEHTVQEEALELSISAVGSTLYLHVIIRELHNGKLSRIDKQISTELDEWVSLYRGKPETTNSHTVGTRARQQQDVYLKISTP